MKTIINKDLIRKAMCAPKSMPDAFLPKKLEPIGTSVFKGDDMPNGLTTNSKFEKDVEYPVYYWEDDIFVIGNDDVGYKMTQIAWINTKIYE